MIKNYFKIALRNLFKDRLYSLINILGLSIGISCCVLIYLYVSYELSYDTFYDKADRIYRLISEAHDPNKVDRFAETSPIMSATVIENFPEIEKCVRFNGSSRSLSYEDKKFYDTKICYSDSSLLDIFSFPVIEGNAKNSLNKPYSIVLTESTAKKYFGETPAVGKIMKLSDTVNITVTAVIKDMPTNSHFNFECFLSRATMAEMNKDNESWKTNNELNWFNCNTFAYALLKEGVDLPILKSKINALMSKLTEPYKKESGMWMNMDLQLIGDVHLKSNLDSEFDGKKNGDTKEIYIFIGTAILMLLIACCNFINLSTAKSINRSKEIGLRKVIGASRRQLIGQFIGESLFFTIISSILSFGFVLIALPIFNSFVGMDLTLNWNVLLVYALIILCVGFLSGSYPALLMSSFTPIKSIKGHVTHGLADIIFRKGLVVFQFSIAIVLIICTTVVLKQLDFIQKRNIGMNREQLLTLDLNNQDQSKLDVILKELQRKPEIVNASANSFSFKGMNNITLLPEGTPKNEITSCAVFSLDENFFSTFQIPIVAGRDFSKNFSTDIDDAFIVNEAAVRDFGWKTPKEAIGKKVEWGMGKEGKIIGVVKDFNFTSLKENIKPLLVNIYPSWFNSVTIRLKTKNLSHNMGEIETLWKSIAPHSPFKYSFIEDDFNSLFQSEIKMRSVLSVFTFLAIFVACLGLFGLAAFSIKQRFREIGIRKVLGSNINGIVKLISKDFLKLVFVSILIAIPIAWFTSNKWLQDFAYRTDLSFWIFLLAGIIALLIAIATVSIQALRAANANPIKSLRTE